MPTLDANTFKTVVTPEVALSIVQKGVAARGWKKQEIAGIKLVYIPYYIFAFDIQSEQPVPTGKAALNGYSGELSDFVPVLLDRPLTKTRNANDGAEVEETSISQSEVKDAAQAKISVQTGIKKDAITISAVSKMYVPFYRVWVNTANDQYKVEVDACLGAPIGLEAVPAVEKGWDDASKGALDKMKSPAGWLELGAGIIPPVGPLQSKPLRQVVFVLAIVAVVYLLFFRGGGLLLGGDKIECVLNDQYLGSKPLIGEQPVTPIMVRGELSVAGKCLFTNAGSAAKTISARVYLKKDNKEVRESGVLVQGLNIPPGKTPTPKEFTITWNGALDGKYTFAYSKFQ